jgi:hypothetical protein
VFGSYWSGIYLVQLNPITGLRISPNSPTYQLAYNSSIEASFIYRHGSYYYLFVNWGSCCDGVDSTYNIRVGRSTNITGPYLDRNGINMVNGGGTLFLRGTGKFTGPGHVGIFSDAGTEWLSIHYYDANAWSPSYNAYGVADLALFPLAWTADNWPTINSDWSAIYHFDSDASDDNRQYTGLLQNTPLIQNDSVHGHVLNFNGTNQYVWLPPGVGYGQTFAAVVKWRGGGPWQRIFDFGFDTTRTVMLTPSGTGVLRCDINPGGNLQILQWTQPLPTNVWTHLAVTLNGTNGVLYVNGSPVATNTGMNLLPVNVAPQTNHLGRSKFTNDAYFNGQFAAFRVYSRALSGAEIVAPIPTISQPADGSFWFPGATISFAGSATDFSDVPLGQTNLTWDVLSVQSGVTNVVFGPVANISNGSFTIPTNTSTGNYIVRLRATDNLARQSTTAVTLLPTNAPSLEPWASFYPFTAGAQDASNRYNGTLLGGASIQSDPIRGNVVNLSGASQYVSLPPAAGHAQTISGWVKWRGGNAWQRIFDFGRDTQHWFFLTPLDASGRMQCALTTDAPTYNRVIQSPIAFPTNQWTHVAVVIDGRQGILYLNGNAIAINNSVNLLPSDVVPTKAFFGKSQFSDPYLNGQIDSMFLASAPISAIDVLEQKLQAPLIQTFNAGNLILSWPTSSAPMQLFATTNFSSWSSITNQPAQSNGTFILSLPLLNGATFYRLQWP